MYIDMKQLWSMKNLLFFQQVKAHIPTSQPHITPQISTDQPGTNAINLSGTTTIDKPTNTTPMSSPFQYLQYTIYTIGIFYTTKI